MGNKNWLTKLLALAGTVLVWLPVLAPVFFSITSLVRSGRFQFDFLMTAELAWLVLVGWALLLWAAIRAKTLVKPIVWSFVSGLVFVVIGQVIAMVTGLASGRTEPTGWQWTLVLAMIGLFILAVISIGVFGILLTIRVFRRT